MTLIEIYCNTKGIRPSIGGTTRANMSSGATATCLVARLSITEQAARLLSRWTTQFVAQDGGG